MKNLWSDEESRSTQANHDDDPSLGLWEDADSSTSRDDVSLHPGIWEKPPSLPSIPRGTSTQQDLEEDPRRRESRKHGRKHRPRHAHRPRRAVATYLLASIAVFVLLVMVDAIYVGLTLRTNLVAVSNALDAGSDTLRAGDVTTARPQFARALSASREAQTAIRHPSFRLASLLPGVGPDARAVAGLVEASFLTAQAGRAGSDAAESLGLRPDGIAAAIFEDGRVDLNALRQASPSLTQANNLLIRAQEHLVTEREPALGRIRSAIRTARSQLTSAAETTSSANALAATMPRLLGAGGTRRYLLAFQALGESRATGGLVGLYGVLRASDGKLSLQQIGSYTELLPITPAEPPSEWFEESYTNQGALRQWQQANVSPSFGAVSEILLDMYRGSTGESLDGLLMMDPITLEGLLSATGPVVVSDGTVSSDNVAEMLLVESYQQFDDPAQQNAFLSSVVSGFWDQVADGDFDVRRFGDAVAEAVSTQHLKFYSRDAEAQSAVADLEADGEYSRLGENVQMVFTNNYAVNKVDYFLERSIDTIIRSASDGDLRVKVATTLTNDAPEGPPDALLGIGNTGLPPGANRSMVNVLVPRGATVASTTIDGDPVAQLTYLDQDRTVAWTMVTLLPGETARVEVEYILPDGGSSLDPADPFEFVLYPQTTAIADTYSLRLVGEGLVGSGKLKSPVVASIDTGRGKSQLEAAD